MIAPKFGSVRVMMDTVHIAKNNAIMYIYKALLRDNNPKMATQIPKRKASTSMNFQNSLREIVLENSLYRFIMLFFIASITNCCIIEHPFL